MARIYNTVKTSDKDYDLDGAFHFAGRNASYRGFGDWYGNSVAMVAVSRDFNTVVIGWQTGYPRGTEEQTEREINEYISKQTAF